MTECPWCLGHSGCDLPEEAPHNWHLEFRTDDDGNLRQPLELNNWWPRGAPNEFKSGGDDA